jgi:hypothetical protein
MELDPTQLITGGGVLACLAALFTALWKGWLWTGPQVAKLEKQYIESLEQERERTSEWRGIALKSISNSDKIGPQLDAILAATGANQALLGALRERAGQQ